MPLAKHEKPGKGATDIWLTPIEIINKLGDFDLDPCGFPGHETARSIFTEADDGLSKQWFGRVWCNPPYSQVGLWLDKLSLHNSGIALVFARTETKWAQRILPKASSVFFPAKRISFLTPEKIQKNGAGAPSMFLAFGEKVSWPFEGWTAK